MSKLTHGSGGCARKLGRRELERLLSTASAARPENSQVLKRVDDHGDVFGVQLHEPAESLLVSADLLYPFCDDAETFGYIAAVHAMSDIYAGLGEPLFGCLTLGASAQEVTTGQASEVVSGIGAALSDHGAALAGGHTIDGELFANLAVTGIDLGYRAFATPVAGDKILLSKPIGSGLALAARAMGLLSDGELKVEHERMREANSHAAATLRQALDQDPEAVRAVTDVSGFGFLDALSMIAPQATTQIYDSSLPTYPQARELVREQAWSGLADANLAYTSEFTSYEDGLGNEEVVTLVNDPQTSGGLLAIVSARASEDILSGSTPAFAAVGQVLSTADHCEVKIVRGKIGEG